MGYVQVGRAKSVQDIDGQLIKVNKDIHESGVNVVFDILHIGCNGLITLLRADKILAILDHDPFSLRRGICLLESSPRSPRSGGGRDKLH